MGVLIVSTFNLWFNFCLQNGQVSGHFFKHDLQTYLSLSPFSIQFVQGKFDKDLNVDNSL